MAEIRYQCPYCNSYIPCDSFLIHRKLCAKIHGKTIAEKDFIQKATSWEVVEDFNPSRR
jgi:hypothetical protein